MCVRLAAAKHRQTFKDFHEPCYGTYQLSCLIAMSNCLSDEEWHHTSQADKPCKATLVKESTNTNSCTHVHQTRRCHARGHTQDVQTVKVCEIIPQKNAAGHAEHSILTLGM